MENIKPLIGYGGVNVIGHWDENNERFIPSTNKEILKEEAYSFLKGNDIYPLAIRVMDNSVDGVYRMYRAIGAKREDKKVLIYAFKDEENNVKIEF